MRQANVSTLAFGGFSPGHQVKTVPQAGWRGVKNGVPLARIAGSFEVFITADKNLRFPAKPLAAGLQHHRCRCEGQHDDLLAAALSCTLGGGGEGQRG